MSDIRVSVAVPTAGRPDYLRSTLRSIAAQTRAPDEVVVSEDGDDPGTAAAVEEAAAGGLPVRLHRNVPPLRQRGNRQRAFELTRGSLVTMLDDDDEWEPQFLERTVETLERHPDCGFVSADHWMIDAAGRTMSDESDMVSAYFGRSTLPEGVYDDVLLRHLRSKPFALGAALFRRSALAAIGFFPEGSGTACDFGLFTELGAARTRAYFLPERLGRYRSHAGQITRDRVLPGADAIGVLMRLARDERLTDEERALAARVYRHYVVEVAIGYAHRRDLRGALRTLRGYPKFGWERPPFRRLAVLALLLAGARASWRTAFARGRAAVRRQL